MRSLAQNQAWLAPKVNSDDDGAPRLELTPGTRIQAKLETQISSAVQAPVVAVVEYTYAIGDRIIVPAGARVYGQLQQADRSGLVSVKFDEIELLDGAREKIDAIGTGLDLGPIKGNVYGKNTGKNFLVRAASGLGSVLAEVAGNNSSAAFSEDDMLRERLAENIGTAGDSEVMSLNANSRVVVSVPADTKIYVVFTKHEQTPAELHKVAPQLSRLPAHTLLSLRPGPSARAFLCGHIFMRLLWTWRAQTALALGYCNDCDRNAAFPLNATSTFGSRSVRMTQCAVGQSSVPMPQYELSKVVPVDPIRDWAKIGPDDPVCG